MATFYINGDYVPEEQAVVPVSDRGFLYGDALFETMLAIGEVVIDLEAHLERLFTSAKALGFKLDNFAWSACGAEATGDSPEAAAWALAASACAETIRRNGFARSYVRLVLSRGAGVFGPRLAESLRARLYVICREHQPPPEAEYKRGWRACLGSGRRDARSPAAGHKTANYLENVLAQDEARRRGGDEALLLNEAEKLCEGATTSLFVVSPTGLLLTPGAASGALAGTVQGRIMRLLAEAPLDGIKEARWAEEGIAPATLAEAAEAFVTNSLLGVMPLVAFEGRAIGQGQPGAITRQLRRRYEDWTARYVAAAAKSSDLPVDV